MSIKENIELFGLHDTEQYVRILTSEFGATTHPSKRGACILEDLPLCAPRLAEDHISMVSFNMIPLPYSLVEALIAHPELFSDDILIRWTQEQDLLLEATLGKLREQAAKP